MVKQTLYQALDSLAEKHIPKGKHELLHVDSQEYWRDLMVDMIERGFIKTKLSTLSKCAVHWEALLMQKINIQN